MASLHAHYRSYSTYNKTMKLMIDQNRSRSPSKLQYDRPLTTLPVEIDRITEFKRYSIEDSKHSLLEMYAISRPCLD